MKKTTTVSVDKILLDQLDIIIKEKNLDRKTNKLSKKKVMDYLLRKFLEKNVKTDVE